MYHLIFVPYGINLTQLCSYNLVFHIDQSPNSINIIYPVHNKVVGLT